MLKTELHGRWDFGGVERDPQELLLGVVAEVRARVPVRVNLKNAGNLKMARVQGPHKAGQDLFVKCRS